jgi:gliding motility-associated-like protein
MVKRSRKWFFTFFCLTGVGLGMSIISAFCQTGIINLNITSTQASCNNTNGTITINTTGGLAPLTYSIDNGLTHQAVNFFGGLDSAQYTVVVKDANGVTATGTVHLTALPTPNVYLGSDTVLCTGSILYLSVPLQPGYTYVWSDNSTGYSFNVTKAGVYSVKVTNQYGCYVSTSINVLFKPTALFSLGNDTTICNGRELQLQPTPMLQGSYLWSNGSTTQSLIIHSPGVYWLKITDSGCVKRDSIRVIYNPNPLVSLGLDTGICAGQTLLLDATNNHSVYTWQDGSSNPTFTVSKPGTYSVKVAKNGCDTSVQVTVSYITKPIVDLVKDTMICVSQEFILDAEYPYSSYRWQDGSVQPRFTVTKAGTYTVQVTDNCGTSRDSTTVRFEDCACRFFVPNAFTPNGDGRNDIFLPKYQCLISNYELKVYNRLGQLIFRSDNASIGWDGSYGGHQQPSDTYVWELDYTDKLTGKGMHKNGTIILIH